jgi:Mycothiol maleylpyruvate isomerase N-terminal domain
VLGRSLVALVGDLDAGAWRLPTACRWSVGDVAGHLLGVELANVSRRRDGHRVDPAPGEAPGAWLAAFNDDWVRAARRLSPRVVAGMLDLAGSSSRDDTRSSSSAPDPWFGYAARPCSRRERTLAEAAGRATQPAPFEGAIPVGGIQCIA